MVSSGSPPRAGDGDGGGGRRGFSVAPKSGGARALAGDLLAPRLVSLVGVLPAGLQQQQHCLGLFERRAEAINGRPSYVQCGSTLAPSESRILLWWCNGWWNVGEARHVDSPTDGCVIGAADRDAMRPDHVKRWMVRALRAPQGEGGSTALGVGHWVNAAELVCTSGFVV